MSKEWHVTIYADGFDGQLTACVTAETASDAEQIVYGMWRDNSRDADAICNECGYTDCVCHQLEEGDEG